MKKRITALFLSIALVVVMLPIVSVPVSAAPSSGNVVQQMGGPVSSKFSLNIDDIIKNYASSKAYEARFYPFGEGEGLPVFIGTAHRVKDINKTDAEIAYLDAMEKAGTDEYSLKQFLNYVKKYEATCQTSAEELQDVLMDAASTALSAAGMSGVELAGNLAGAASIGTGTGSVLADMKNGEVDTDTIISGAFTLGDLAGLAGGVLGVGVLSTVGSVAAVGGIGYTMFQKYMEHQEQWKDFANYLLGRRNLTEFFKYLDAELKEVMKSGWDIQFNACEYVDDQAKALGVFNTPITYTFQARFMRDYVSEFEFGQVHNANEDGWAGSLEMHMSADLSAIEQGFSESIYCTTKIITDEPTSLMEFDFVDDEGHRWIRTVDMDYLIKEDLYWQADLTCLNFPLKTDSLDESQSQIVFEGSLSSGSYVYRQGGNVETNYKARTTVDGSVYDVENAYSRLYLTQEGHFHAGDWYHWCYGGVLVESDPWDGGDPGCFYSYDRTIKHTKAKMVIDLTKQLGYATN